MVRAAGIQVDGPVLEDDARALNPGFVRRMERKLPYVRCKMAMSIDGRTAMESGESKWITGPKARADVQRLRARSCAIISGVDSILKDNASLTVRVDELGLPNAEEAAAKQPLRVILRNIVQMVGDGAPHIFTRVIAQTSQNRQHRCRIGDKSGNLFRPGQPRARTLGGETPHMLIRRSGPLPNMTQGSF